MIAGGGAAGSVLAARLSEDERTTVLLLEAGPDLRPTSAPAALRSQNVFRAMEGEMLGVYTWDGLSARRADGQDALPYLRGRGLGGSSAMNGTIAAHAFPEDFDAWLNAGCRGWGWHDVFPSRLRLEDDLDFGDRSYHGRGGPVPISRAAITQWGATGLALREAALDLGYGWEEDLNDPAGTGASPFAHACRHGRRVSVSDAYLEPARGRPNLTIRCDTLVDRVLVENGAAVGIAALGPDGVETVFHAGEIVVCGGTIGTPGILVRSGIGPRTTLARLGIPAVADLPVGGSYRDHCGVGLTVSLREEFRTRDPEARSMTCGLRYSSDLADGGRNDMNVFALNVAGGTPESAASGYVKASVYETFSNGEVRVVSRDPRVHPQIEMNLLSDERDLVRLRDGVRRLAELVRHQAFGRISGAVGTTTNTVFRTSDAGGFTLDDIDDDRALDAWLKASVNDTAHGVGTCPMGSAGDPSRVVDPDCRVVGVRSLRVIDASVMPAMPRVNTMLPTLVVAEHMAARLRGETEEDPIAAARPRERRA